MMFTFSPCDTQHKSCVFDYSLGHTKRGPGQSLGAQQCCHSRTRELMLVHFMWRRSARSQMLSARSIQMKDSKRNARAIATHTYSFFFNRKCYVVFWTTVINNGKSWKKLRATVIPESTYLPLDNSWRPVINVLLAQYSLVGRKSHQDGSSRDPLLRSTILLTRLIVYAVGFYAKGCFIVIRRRRKLRMRTSNTTYT